MKNPPFKVYRVRPEAPLYWVEDPPGEYETKTARVRLSIRFPNGYEVNALHYFDPKLFKVGVFRILLERMDKEVGTELANQYEFFKDLLE
jgi:hypothetical protein